MVETTSIERIQLKYGKLRINLKKTESFIFYATFIAGEYNRLKIKMDDVVIDAGANVGDFTVKAAFYAKMGEVIAIEPIMQNVQMIRENASLNNLTNIQILPYALSDESGVAYIDGNKVTSSILSESKSSIQVNTITIEEVIRKYCPPEKKIVLKMDIEGAEKLVFKNPDFLKRVRELVIELHGEENVSGIPGILESYGFKVTEFSLLDQMTNTIKSITKHPYSFAAAELKTGFVAFRGLMRTVKGSNPIASVDNPRFKLVYASNFDSVRL